MEESNVWVMSGSFFKGITGIELELSSKSSSVRQTVFTATEIHNAFFFVSRLYNVVGMH
jgi:hypothetical protein